MNEIEKPTTELSGAERQQRSYETRMARVAALIAQGYTLPAIALQPGTPSIATLRQLLAEDEQLREAYEQARDLRNEQLADDAVALADALADTNNAGLKLRIDARKWRVALDRKDGKKLDKNASAKETLEHLQRALEQARKQDEEERIARYGVDTDEETSDGGEIGDFSFKG